MFLKNKPKLKKKMASDKLTSLSLDFPVYKMRVIIIPTSQDCVIIKIK